MIEKKKYVCRNFHCISTKKNLEGHTEAGRKLVERQCRLYKYSFRDYLWEENTFPVAHFASFSVATTYSL